MELMIGFVIALALAMLAAEDGWLGQDSERAWVNRLADESRRRARRGKMPRQRQRYTRAGWRPGERMGL